jgi:hypothetical protein
MGFVGISGNPYAGAATPLALFLLLATSPAMSSEQTIFDFRNYVGPQWYAINDGVMGGVSQGRAQITEDGLLVFSGMVSLENNGGFASIRSEPSRLAIQGASGVRLEVRGDGHRYKLNLKLDAAFDGIQYQAEFQPPAGEWVTATLPFSSFAPKFRGRPVPDAPPLEPSRVVTVGFLISDKQTGPFLLEIRAIRAY